MAQKGREKMQRIGTTSMRSNNSRISKDDPHKILEMEITMDRQRSQHLVMLLTLSTE